MLRDRLIQLNKRVGLSDRGARQPDQSPPVMRSPALQSAQRRSMVQAEHEARLSAARAQKGSQVSRRRPAVARPRSAVKPTLSTPVLTHKRLPPLRSRVSQADIPFAGSSLVPLLRGRRSSLPERQVLPVQIMSIEEQQTLASLEMQLPRVAGRSDAMLLLVTLALLCIGLVMVFSASSFIAVQCCDDASYIFQKQLLGATLGFALMLVTMRIDYRHWRRLSLPGLMIVLPLLVIVLRFGTSTYGASRWLGFGSFFSFQPSELIKLVLALYIADWLARKGRQVGTFLYGLAPFVILVGIILGLVLLEKDMGTAVVIAGLATAMFFTAGANVLQFVLAMGCGCAIFLTQAVRGYRLLRLIGFLSPLNTQYMSNLNLQLYQSLLALGSGGWFGLGLGASRQKTGYLPLPYIDSIFAVIGEELGFIGSALILLLFLLLAFRGFRLARRTQDMYGALLATGITTWLVLQALINIAATTASVPYTGVPLPFISFGGSSLVVSLAAVGVLLNISRYTRQPENPAFSRQTLTLNLRKKTKMQG